MRRASRLARLALLGAAASVACTGERSDAERVAQGDPPSPPVAGDTVRYGRRTVTREEGRCRRDGIDPAAVPCVTVALRYPDGWQAAAPAVAESLAAVVRRAAFGGTGEDSAPLASADAAADRFVADYRAAAAGLGDRVEVWALERTVAVACNTPRVVGLRADEYHAAGGAHPNAWSRLTTVDARTGRRLGLAELFVPESLPAVTRVAERAFRRERGIPAGRSLDDAGFTGFADDRFALPDNVLACGDAVTFRFDPYDVAPYALGATEFTVPLDELRAHRRPDAPGR